MTFYLRKNYVNVASKSNKEKNLEYFFCHLEGHWQKQQDPLVRGTDPRIRICTKMSRIRNTDKYSACLSINHTNPVFSYICRSAWKLTSEKVHIHLHILEGRSNDWPRGDAGLPAPAGERVQQVPAQTWGPWQGMRLCLFLGSNYGCTVAECRSCKVIRILIDQHHFTGSVPISGARYRILYFLQTKSIES